MIYIGDIRADEGLRIREDGISPCLHVVQGGYLTNVPVIIEVNMIRDIRLLGGKNTSQTSDMTKE